MNRHKRKYRQLGALLFLLIFALGLFVLWLMMD